MCIIEQYRNSITYKDRFKSIIYIYKIIFDKRRGETKIIELFIF